MNCKHCMKVVTNKGSLVAHEACCLSNPDRIVHRRGVGAGRQKGCVSPTRGMKLGRATHWDDKFPLVDVLVENSTYPRHCLKKRIIDGKLLEYTCSLCGVGPEWHGKEMPLILDHINGINDDNRLKNLRFVCSNCDSTLPTYKSRNKRSNTG